MAAEDWIPHDWGTNDDDLDGDAWHGPSRCRYCGKSGLRWWCRNGKWRLVHTDDGSVHSCPEFFRKMQPISETTPRGEEGSP